MRGGIAWTPGDLPVRVSPGESVQGTVAITGQYTLGTDRSLNWTATVMATGIAEEWLRSHLAPLNDADRIEEAASVEDEKALYQAQCDIFLDPSDPKVQEAAAIGIPHPTRGEAIKAFIALKDGETATEEEIIAYCTEKLAKFKLPTEVEFKKELPKTNVGKILKKDLMLLKNILI